jgi:hypothetical protein
MRVPFREEEVVGVCVSVEMYTYEERESVRGGKVPPAIVVVTKAVDSQVGFLRKHRGHTHEMIVRPEEPRGKKEK